MRKIVVKFGGSNLKTKEDISKLIRVIKGYRQPIVIVISALFGVTDNLVKTIQKVKYEAKAISRLKHNLIDAHERIIKMYIDDITQQEQILNKIKERVEELGRCLLGVHYLGDIPDFAEDKVLSYGERLSSLILESILNYMNIECEEVLPEKIGLITDGEHRNATVDFSVAEENVKKVLISKSKNYIIPGFYGISPNCRVTLLGRGGSDYSAAAIARCIDAASVDIWKDVSGFMSADPKLVKNPHIIDKLTYREAAELSYFGARILHPRTFEPVMDKNIPIRLYDINNFSEDLEPLTVIQNQGVVKDDVVKSVTFSDDFGILILRGPGVGIKPGIMAKVTTQLNNARINIKSIVTSQTAINILLSLEDLKRSFQMMKQIDLPAVDEILCVNGISLIAVVGEGMLEKSGIAARVFGAVSSHKINILTISAGASTVATYFIIDKKDRIKAIRAIHKEFFR